MTPERLARLIFLANFVAYHVPGDGDEQLKDVDAGDDMLELCEAVAGRPRTFHNTKWKGQGGFGDIGRDQRVLLQRERRGERHYVTIVDDDIYQCITLTPRQVPKVIAALTRALEAERESKN